MTPQRSTYLALCCLLLSVQLSGCSGGEASTPPIYGELPEKDNAPGDVGEPEDPMMGGEPMMMGGEPMMGGYPVAGEVEPPMGGEPLCEVLNLDSIGLFLEGGDNSVANTLSVCGECHSAPGSGSYLLPQFITNNSNFSPDQIEQIYNASAAYINPGYGEDSQLVVRMSDDHSNFSNFGPEDPQRVAMVDWINSLTPCD